MNKLEVIKEIEDLVNSNPCMEVDMQPIILKHCEGKDMAWQKIIRQELYSILEEVKKLGEIEYQRDKASFALMQTSQGAFLTNQLMIKSTLQYERERTKPPPPTPQNHHYNISTKGNNSPVVAGSTNTEIGKEDNEIAKEGLKISRKTLAWTIAGILSATLLGILAVRYAR